MNFKFSKKTMCILFVLLMVFISLGTVSAMEVNSTDDVDSSHNQLKLENDNEKLSISNDENILSSAETFNGTTFSELQNKINSLNNSDVLDLTSNVTQDGSSEITISKSITINGNGVTIDAKGNSRIFYINGGETVILNNITFINGKSDDYGGAIGIYSPCKIENCTFTNNTAHDGGAIGIREKSTVTNCNFTDNSANKYRGGAIYADEELIVTDCNFVNNHAYYNDAGAIFFYGIGNVSNCNFTNNYANYGRGGAVCFLPYGTVTNCNFANNCADNSWGGAVYFSFKGNATNCTFTNNTASERGGAMYIESGNVINCNFTNNHATSGDGGALYFYTSSTVMNSDFTNNTARRQGGAINFYYEGTVVNCNFTNNIASRLHGGAVNFEERNGTVANSNFVNNQALYEGGAINFDKSSGIVTNCYFANHYEFDGAVHIYENGIVSNCSFVNNSGLNNGAIDFDNNCTVINCNFINSTIFSSYGYGGAVDLGINGTAINCNFTNNTAVNGHGGALYIHNNGSVTNCNFVNNKATGEESLGGAVYIYDGCNVTNCNFTSNNASQRGGAIYIYMTGSVTNCNFNNNTASQIGGAIYITNINNLTNCNFTSNTASNGGGAAWITSGTVENCNFVDNQATGAEPYGGAINFDGENCTVKNCNFTGNKAPHNYEYGGGGAIYFRVKGTVLNSNFADNSAKNRGGAIYLDNGGNVTNSSFTNNAADKRGGAIYISEGNVTNCNFTKNNAEYGSGIETFKCNVSNCNFNNHNSAIHSNRHSIVANSNFTNNYAPYYAGAGICFEYDGEVINCNFVNNTAADARGGAICFGDDGNVTNCNFTKNNAINGGAITFDGKGTVTNSNFVNNAADIAGAAILFEDIGELTNCNFVNNYGYMGAVTFRETGDITSCNFTNNTASYGGSAVWIKSGNVTNCNFIGNTAKVGSAIYFSTYDHHITSIISNSYFLNNRADVDQDAPFILNMTENTIEITFVGGNNYINAIHTNVDFNLSFNNVTYWGANGIANTDSTAPVRSNREAGQNITVKAMINGNRLNITKITDKDGKIVLNGNFDKDYLIVIRHYSDSYYTEAKQIITNNKYHVNATSQTTHNKTVNITAKSNIIQDVVEGTLFFILPDGTTIKANHVSNDTWWAVHTFDNYTEYNISAEYIGLDNVTVRNATVNITKADSTIPLDDISMDYGSFTKITVETEGATGITADINGTQSIILNNNTILIFDLDIGNYTLTVTTIPDEDHNSVNKTVNLTVNKLNSTLTVDDVVLDYGESKNVTVTTEGATGITAKINGSDVNVIDNYTIPVSDLGAGNYTLTVTTITDKYHNPATATATITVNKAPAIITVIDELINLYAKETLSDFANLTPKDAGSLNYVSSNEDVAKIVDGKIIAVGAGKAKITVSFEGNDNYTQAESKNIYVIVKPVESGISVNKTEFELVVGEEADIIANATPEGLVIEYATDDTNIISVDENGHITALSNGTALIIVSVGDNRNYDYAYVDVIVNVKKATEIDINVSSEENDVTVTATVDSSTTGLVKFNINDETVYIEVNNGKAVYELILPAGDYNVEATYLGDNNYKSNGTSKEFTVAGHVKQNTTIDSNVIVDNYNATITVTVNANATGFVKFTLNGNEIFAEVKDGKAIINTMLPVGNYTIPATYLGDDDFNTNTTNIEVEVKEIPLKDTPITADINMTENNITITVNVDLNATGLVKFDVTGTENYTLYIEIENSKAILEDVLTTGNYTTNITYLGNQEYNQNTTTKTFTVTGHIKKDTTITAIPSVNENTVTIKTTVDFNATGYVAIAVLGQTFIVPVENGEAVFTYDFNPDTYNATVTYIGDDNFNNATTTTSFTITEQVVELKNTTINVNVISNENNVTITAKINVSATGLVEFNINGRTMYIAVNNGEAVLNLIQPVGNYTVVATYLGNSKFNSNRTSETYTVVDHIKQNTTITHSIESEGNNVTITVNVDPNATGFIKFTINGNKIFTEVDNGKAVINTMLPVGNYTIPVEYLGDDDFNTNTTNIDIEVKEIPLKDTPITADINMTENNITITANVDPNATGLIKFDVTGTENYTLYIEIENGKAILEDVLTTGNYTTNITYLGNQEYNQNTTTKTFTVTGHIKKDTTITAIPSVNENTVTIVATVDTNATGSVTIAVLGQTFIVPVKNGKAMFNYDFRAGTYSADVTYLGDDNFNNATTKTSFTVTEQVVELKNTTINVDVNSSENNVTITAKVNNSASGLVEFNIGGNVVYIAVDNGEAIYKLALPAGNYTVIATYLGDYKFNSNKTSKTYTVVDHIIQNTTITPTASVDENNVTITVNVNPNATGFVKFTINGNDIYSEVKDGKAIMHTMLPVGNYTVPATYLGDDDFNTNTTNIEVEVKEIPLKDTPITADINMTENNITITVNVDSNATGLVKFDVTGTENYTLYIEIENGKAILEDVLTTGNYTTNITYLGNQEYNPNTTTKTFTVTGHIKKDTTITAVSSVDENTATIVATVDTNATGSVTIGVLGQTFIVPVKNGKAVFKYDFNPGTYSANVVYLGDDNFNNATTTTSFTVIKKDISLKNTTIDVTADTNENNVTITATVDNSASGIIEFNIEDKTFYIPVNNGEATLNTVLPAGDYNVEVTYLGDDKFNANKTSNAFTVVDHIKQNTTITPTVTVDSNNVTITVNVDPNATGLIKFTLNGNDVLVKVIDGKAVINTMLPVGNYTVPATYLGDNDFNENATEITFSVDAPESADVNITVPSDVKEGENTEITVDIPNATGNVSIIVDGVETIVPLVNGSASIPLENISAGKHNVVVIYEGDENNAPAHSASSFNVEPKPVKESTKFIDITVENNIITATLVGSDGEIIPNAVISYTIGTASNTTTTDSKGLFSIPLEFNKEIAIAYDGSDKYLKTNTSLIFKDATPVKLETHFNIPGNSITITGYAVDTKAGEQGMTYATELLDSMGNPISNTAIQFGVNNKIYNRTTYEDGSFAPYHLDMIRAGRYTMAFSFGGNDQYNSTFAVVCVDLDKKPITIKASAKTYKATAKTKKYTVTLSTIVGSSLDGKAHLRTGLKVTMKLNGKTYTAKTNSKGQATFKLKITKKGKFAAVISYKGSKTYEEATKKVKITIK